MLRAGTQGLAPAPPLSGRRSPAWGGNLVSGSGSQQRPLPHPRDSGPQESSGVQKSLLLCGSWGNSVNAPNTHRPHHLCLHGTDGHAVVGLGVHRGRERQPSTHLPEGRVLLGGMGQGRAAGGPWVRGVGFCLFSAPISVFYPLVSKPCSGPPGPSTYRQARDQPGRGGGHSFLVPSMQRLAQYQGLVSQEASGF